jgi:hypothetical protein
MLARYTLLLLALFHGVSLAQVIRINAGSGRFTDPSGNYWADDAYFNSGHPSWECPKEIANTTNDELYCSYRWFAQVGQPYRYQVPVLNATYTVRLHFAEM